jgi:signal peptidase I
MNKKTISAQKAQENNSSAKSVFSRENVEAILIAVILALFIRTFVVQAFKIPSGSMLQTIQLGDHILVNKFIYGIKIPFTDKTLIPVKDPQRGDIIVFTPPHEPKKDYIKRVVGIAGDVIEIRNKKLYVNGEYVTGPYEIHTESRIIPQGPIKRDNMEPVTVPDGCLFMMGDNRDNSQDSRYWGFARLEKIKGKAMFIYWSWNSEEFGGLKDVNWSRIGHWVRWGRIGDWLK